MNGNEFLQRLKGYAETHGLELRFDARRGKGSHGTVYLGDRRTTLKDRTKELSEDLLRSMLKQLGISRRDI